MNLLGAPLSGGFDPYIVGRDPVSESAAAPTALATQGDADAYLNTLAPSLRALAEVKSGVDSFTGEDLGQQLERMGRWAEPLGAPSWAQKTLGGAQKYLSNAVWSPVTEQLANQALYSLRGGAPAGAPMQVFGGSRGYAPDSAQYNALRNIALWSPWPVYLEDPTTGITNVVRRGEGPSFQKGMDALNREAKTAREAKRSRRK